RSEPPGTSAPCASRGEIKACNCIRPLQNAPVEFANDLSIMTRKNHLFLLALAVVVLGFAAGRPLFLPALKLLFTGWFHKLPEYSDAEKAKAAWNFCLGF